MTPTPAAPPPTRPAETSQPPVPRPVPPRRVLVWHAAALGLALMLTTTVPAGRAIAQVNAAPPAPAPGVDTALAYCSNLADAASDARFAKKAARLQALEDELEKRLQALEKKRAEHQEWLDKRQRFLALAQKNVVSIYTAMRPDAASEQLAAMDDLTAAAIIARLTPRSASAVLNEMATDKAARIATIISGMAQKNDDRSEG